MTPVPFVDLGRQHETLRAPLQDAFSEIVKRNDFILGPALESFEAAFASYLGAPFAVGVASGTEALHLSLRALGIGPGDEVIVPTLTFAATALAVLYAGAEPVLVDVEPETFLIDPSRVEAALTPKTRAIIPVHLYGRACDPAPLQALADRHSLAIVEDACQAHGSAYRGRKTGTWGRAGCFSFFPSKNLGALGDGGMIATSDSKLRDSLRTLRNYGQRVKYHHEGLGFNSRLDSLQAALLEIKLSRLDDWNEQRRQIAQRYAERLRGVPIRLPEPTPDPQSHVYHLYVIRTPRRDALQSFLKEKGIATGIHYPIPLHRLELPYGKPPEAGRFPVAERLCQEILSLPMFPGLRPDEIDAVADGIRAYFESHA